MNLKSIVLAISLLLVTTPVIAGQQCWGINEKIKIFQGPTASADLSAFILSLSSNSWVDTFSGVSMAGTIYGDIECNPIVCGDSYCDVVEESCATCPFDCPICEDSSKYCTTCPVTPPPSFEFCGNSKCVFPEICSSCPQDCGVCPPPIEPYVYCCEENQTCTFVGSRSVRYGANGAYNYMTFSGSTPCTNAVFDDPIVGTVKQCYYGPELSCVQDPTTCNAPTPTCGQTTWGTDSCNLQCSKSGPVCPCVPDHSCDNLVIPCGQTQTCTDNCGNVFLENGPTCCVSNPSICSAPMPACEQTTTGIDNCGVGCTKKGPACCTFSVCNAPTPICTQSTTGTDNCGKSCTKTTPCTPRYYILGNKCYDRLTGNNVKMPFCKQ